MAVIDGQHRIAQYGQWDGYPSGQGTGIINFIRNEMDIEEFRAALRECRYLSRKELGAIRDDDDRPEFDRNTGSKILSLVQGGLRELVDSSAFMADSHAPRNS